MGGSATPVPPFPFATQTPAPPAASSSAQTPPSEEDRRRPPGRECEYGGGGHGGPEFSPPQICRGLPSSALLWPPRPRTAPVLLPVLEQRVPVPAGPLCAHVGVPPGHHARGNVILETEGREGSSRCFRKGEKQQRSDLTRLHQRVRGLNQARGTELWCRRPQESQSRFYLKRSQ